MVVDLERKLSFDRDLLEVHIHVPLLGPLLHHFFHVLGLVNITHPLLHHFIVLLLAQISIVIIQQIVKEFLLGSLRHLLLLNFTFQVFVPALSLDFSERLQLILIFDEFVFFKSVSAVVQLVQEFEEFAVAVLRVRRGR